MIINLRQYMDTVYLKGARAWICRYPSWSKVTCSFAFDPSLLHESVSVKTRTITPKADMSVHK